MPKAVQPPATVDVIIPARNEQDCIRRCLQSLIAQEGIRFRITVVDDSSTDQTRAIAQSILGVEVISCSEPPPGITGKNNALITATARANREWILFTDADTFHLPYTLAHAVREAQDYNADLLSDSPEQETGSLAEMALMPLVFAELTGAYPTDRVNNQRYPVAAANGQYLLVRRAVYEKLGGHRSVAGEILEDVALARLFKQAGYRIRFGHGAGLVRARMYRSFSAMWEGWTKNLALLFPHPLWMAARNALMLLVLAGLFAYGIHSLRHPGRSTIEALLWLSYAWLAFLVNIRRAHFPWRAKLLAFFGLPLFVSLLVRSYLHSRVRRRVTWKGRTYTQGEAAEPFAASMDNAGAEPKELT